MTYTDIALLLLGGTGIIAMAALLLAFVCAGIDDDPHSN